MNMRLALAACLVLMSLCLPGSIFAAPAEKTTAVRVKVHDLQLVNQDNRPVMFKRDVVADRLVVIAFTYTTCTTICPILDSILAKLQDKLGERFNREVFLVTLSIDPVNDIPSRLKSHAVKLKARPGWEFLTGSKVNMDRVLLGLDMYTPDILRHSPAILVGDGRSGAWRRFYGFPSADKLMNAINEMLAARGGK